MPIFDTTPSGGSTSGVTSFNGRTGAVTPQNGDYTAEQVGAVPASSVGQAGGVASLDSSGLVPASQLPGFVDDVVDAYVVGSTPYAADWLSLTSGGAALTPAASTIYLIVSAGEYQNQQYRWSGTQYAIISQSLALGETSDTAYRGDRGKTAYDHSQITNSNPHGVTAEMIGAADADTTGQALQALSDEVDGIITGTSPITLPVATEAKVGGVKVGENLSVAEDGTLSTGAARRYARVVVGVSTAGWTSADCDYLCDGADDQKEINAAISSLPSTGGEVVLLDGTYSISASVVEGGTTINLNKENITLMGSGPSTILSRTDTNGQTIISVTAANVKICNIKIDGSLYASYGGQAVEVTNSDNFEISDCYIHQNYGDVITATGSSYLKILRNYFFNNSGNYDIQISGNSTDDPAEGIIISGNTMIGRNNFLVTGIKTYGTNKMCITENTMSGYGLGISFSAGPGTTICNNRIDATGISQNNTGGGIHDNSGSISNGVIISGNVITCSSEYGNGINLSIGNGSAIVTNNYIYNFNNGISVAYITNGLISGNVVLRGTGQSSDYAYNQYTIDISNCTNCLVIGNSIMGKNYTETNGTNNTFENNKFE